MQKCDDYDDNDYDDNDDSDGCKDIYQDEPEELMSDPRLVLWSPLRSETSLLYHVRQINLSREWERLTFLSDENLSFSFTWDRFTFLSSETLC